MSEKLTWLNYSPVIFPGFSGSLIAPEVYVDFWRDQGYDDLEEIWEISPNFWKAYMCIVGDKAAELIKVAVDKFRKGVILDVKFKQVWSPNYYNTSTDRLFLTLNVRKDKLDNWILQHSRGFCEYLADHWTSREGFTSVVPNTFVKLLKSPFYEKITIEYFIREACLRLGCTKDMECRLYNFILDLLPEDVDYAAEHGGFTNPVRDGMLALA